MTKEKVAKKAESEKERCRTLKEEKLEVSSLGTSREGKSTSSF